MSTSISPVDGIVENAVWKPITNAAIAALIANQPWMGVWPMEPLVRGILDQFSAFLFRELDTSVDLAAIKLLNEQHQAAFETAMKAAQAEPNAQNVAAAQAALAALTQFAR